MLINTLKSLGELPSDKPKQYKYFKYNKETGYLKFLNGDIVPEINYQRIRVNDFYVYHYFVKYKELMNPHEKDQFIIMFYNNKGHSNIRFYFDSENDAIEALTELDEQLIDVHNEKTHNNTLKHKQVYDDEYLKSLREQAKKSWKDIKDPERWLQELRGHYDDDECEYF